MKILYKYKDRKFSDIRDIVYNNKLEIDFDYIMEEYLPFQVFISGKTIFKGLTIESSIMFNPFEYQGYLPFNNEIFSNSIEEYLDDHGFDKEKKFMAAVSGGIDSSVVALETRPPIIYSGYYKEAFFDETSNSGEIAKKIGAVHYKYELNEIDFLENMGACIEAICTPVAGLGSVMEYATLKKVIKSPLDIKQVLFGNGGDEIFMGYFFNYYVKEFYFGSYEIPEYMPNFLPSRKAIAEKLIDFMIVASLSRSESISSLYSSFVRNKFMPMISSIPSVVDKLLYVNINITLPTLLHLNNQFTKSAHVSGFNPLANKDLIRRAKSINSPMSEIPKESLRNINPDLPKKVKTNYIKRGFPIPTDRWDNLRDFIRTAYDSFFLRPEITLKKTPYSGINRYTWGVSQAELCLRRFKK